MTVVLSLPLVLKSCTIQHVHSAVTIDRLCSAPFVLLPTPFIFPDEICSSHKVCLVWTLCIAGEHIAFSKGCICGSDEAGMVTDFKVYCVYKKRGIFYEQFLNQLVEAKKVLCTC